jgi:hypothetical protein
MNYLIICLVFAAHVEIGEVKIIKPEAAPAPKICRLKGNECKSLGPKFSPICIGDGAMKGAIVCEKKGAR